ncbi:MAG: IS3 family transposase, partial [Methanoregulaceae archaeon]|nr:IS3 family transposase [Methanoregulaceae archaeon]
MLAVFGDRSRVPEKAAATCIGGLSWQCAAGHDLDRHGVRGYPRIWVKLRREGWMVNRKRVYRLYRQEGLCVGRHKPRRHRSAATRVNESWSMDFMADQLFDGRKFRLLTLVDDFSRESPVIELDQR